MSGHVTIEDVLAVQDLLGRYCWYLDEGCGPEWAALFTADGIFEGTRPQPVCGTAALAQVPVQLKAHGQGKMRHQVSNLHIVEGEHEDILIARFYNELSNWGAGGQPVMLALSTATLVRNAKDSPWLIQRNTIRFP